MATIKFLLTMTILFSTGHSKAQEEENADAIPATDSTKKGVLKMDFEDQLVTGNRDNPDAQFIFTRTQFNFQKMIKFREDFIPEATKGKDEFRGKR